MPLLISIANVDYGTHLRVSNSSTALSFVAKATFSFRNNIKINRCKGNIGMIFCFYVGVLFISLLSKLKDLNQR